MKPQRAELDRSPSRHGVLKQAWANPSAPKWFRVVAIDASGRRAWTNPIWIDELAVG